MAEPIHDETFGRLEWDPLLSSWLGGIDRPPGLHTEVVIEVTEGNDADRLREARDGLSWLIRNEQFASRSVARAIVVVYNDAWRGEEEPITEDELMRRIELVWVKFEVDGSLLLSYGGRDLFGGHMVDGRFGADRKFLSANLVG